MTSKERVLTAINHREPDMIPVDFGATPVTGIHVLAVERLREYYGLEKRPVKVTEPYQMLGDVDEALREAMGVDVIGLSPKNNMFGFDNGAPYKEFKTCWGQVVLVPENFNTTIDANGDLLIYPEGDPSVPPSGKMPKSGYFFDAVIRQDPLEEDKLNPEDNLEEFSPVSQEDLDYWKREVDKVKNSGKMIIANFGGTAFGDIALVPGLNLKHPKGIRDVTEWYMSTLMRPDYIHAIFDKQSEIAIGNLEKIYKTIGDNVDGVFICGTDFGTQDSQFCGPDTLEDLYVPYYKKINNWIHEHTSWKTFKHSCGAVEPFINTFIDSGFDILNPVQIGAAGMDPQHLKDTYGDRITFWGGGVDTQKVLPFGTPEDVKRQVRETCRIFAEGGGFVFNTVHNVQANVPVENLTAMLEALKEVRGR